MSDLCPCGSGQKFDVCCEPFLLEQASPKTAAQLMRSRYCAYAMGVIDYLYKTSGPRVRKEFDAENSRKWAESAKWNGMEIVKTEGGSETDTTGTVEFIARYAVKEKEFEHHEVAQFEKVDDTWAFIDGKIFGTEPMRREAPKVGRNDPCVCGSGKKYKKCCGQAKGE
ncbi:MAG: YchJ family protein [bacterium]